MSSNGNDDNNHNSPRFRLKVLIHDLLNYTPDTWLRIYGYQVEDNNVDGNAGQTSHLLSTFYFTNNQINELRPAFIEIMADIANKHSEDGNGNGNDVCTSHTIAPMIMEKFDITKREMKDVRFKREYKKFVRRH